MQLTYAINNWKNRLKQIISKPNNILKKQRVIPIYMTLFQIQLYKIILIIINTCKLFLTY